MEGASETDKFCTVHDQFQNLKGDSFTNIASHTALHLKKPLTHGHQHRPYLKGGPREIQFHVRVMISAYSPVILADAPDEAAEKERFSP